MTRSSKSDPNHDALSESPVFGDRDAENFDEAFEDDDDPVDEEWDDLDEDEDEDDSGEGPVASTGRTRGSRRRSRRDSESTGSPMLAIGLLGAGLLWGIASIVASAPLGTMNSTLGSVGLTPGAVILAGVVMLAVHRLGQQQGRQTGQVLDGFESIAAQLESLGAPQEGGDLIAEQLDRVLLSADRQLEKIQNLTKATKMYGKPLVDISKQVADLGVHLGEVSRLPEQFQTFLKEQQRAAENSDLDEQLREVGRATRAVQSSVREIHDQLGQALAKRIEGLSKQITQATAELSKRDDDSSDAEELAAIRRELQAVTTGLSQLSTKMSQISARAAAGPAGGGSSASSAGTDPIDTHSPQSPGDAPVADGALAQKIAGSRPGGKGVMSAIEKLKSMRG